MKTTQIVAYAKTKEGFVQRIGTYDGIEQITIIIGLWDRGTQITFEHETVEND